MAQEITASAAVTFNGKDPLPAESFPALSGVLDMAGTLYECGVQTITEAAELAIEIGGIGATSVGLIVLYNTDLTNFITYGLTGNRINKLSPGMFAFVESDGSAAPFAKADTADVVIKRWIFEA